MMATTAAIPSIMGTMTDDPSSLLAKEWLITNGIGGYASSSLLGIATRRYHGVFVPDLPGRGRTLLIPRLDETVEWATQTVLLSGAEYADGRIEHDGARRDPQAPDRVLVEGQVLGLVLGPISGPRPPELALLTARARHH